MYNRYVGNTGKFYRVDEPGENSIIKPPPAPYIEAKPRSDAAASSFLSLKNILPHGLSGGLKGMLNGILPEKMDVGDLLLILILLLLYLEKEDEEILIILGALIFLGFK